MDFGGKKPKTQNEVAQILGISRSYVSRIETKAIKKLNDELEETWKTLPKVGRVFKDLI